METVCDEEEFVGGVGDGSVEIAWRRGIGKCWIRFECDGGVGSVLKGGSGKEWLLGGGWLGLGGRVEEMMVVGLAAEGSTQLDG